MTLEVNLEEQSRTGPARQAISESRGPAWVNAGLLLVWLAAGVVPFLPFAYSTSAWNAVTLNVPGNQGNWWHFLVGAPFFLAYPMIWLRLRALFAGTPSTAGGRRVLWVLAGLSAVGTLLVETPFLLHLAGTRGWPRLSMLTAGLGIVALSAAILSTCRNQMPLTQACLTALNTAYLANAALCLVVYAGAPGDFSTRSGWTVAMVLVWPMAAELVWLWGRALRRTRQMVSA
jgi:hypothetical protein